MKSRAGHLLQRNNERGADGFWEGLKKGFKVLFSDSFTVLKVLLRNGKNLTRIFLHNVTSVLFFPLFFIFTSCTQIIELQKKFVGLDMKIVFVGG